MALIDRTAYPRLPSSVAERDLVEVFTPTAEEAQWAWTQVLEPQARLVLLVMHYFTNGWGISRSWARCRRR